jgi:predicted small lipoprotein YifL
MLQRAKSVAAGLKAASTVCSWLAFLAIGVFASACGQKGPLMLPASAASAPASGAAPVAPSASAVR